MQPNIRIKFVGFSLFFKWCSLVGEEYHKTAGPAVLYRRLYYLGLSVLALFTWFVHRVNSTVYSETDMLKLCCAYYANCTNVREGDSRGLNSHSKLLIFILLLNWLAESGNALMYLQPALWLLQKWYRQSL